MQKIVIVLITCAVMFGGTTVQAQSVELLDALKIAEERLKQGEHVHAFDPLQAILSEASADPPNVALGKLVQELLENRRSRGAIVAAQAIDNQELRNRILFDILQRQCYATTYRPSEFDLMIDKAEQTVLLLAGEFRDRGYNLIAQKYINFDQFDRALETLKKVEDIERRDVYGDEGYFLIAHRYLHIDQFDKALESLKKVKNVKQRDAWLVGLDQRYCSLEYRSYDPRHFYFLYGTEKDKFPEIRTLEHESRLRNILELIQTPSEKIRALLILSELYSLLPDDVIPDAVRKEKIYTLLQKIAEHIRPLTDDGVKFAYLHHLHRYYHDLKDEPKADEVRKTLFEVLVNIENGSVQSHCFSQMCWLLYDRSNQAKFFDFIEEMKVQAEKTADPQIRADLWRNLMWIENHWYPAGSEERMEAFNKALEASMKGDDTMRWPLELLSYHALPGRTEAEKAEALIRTDAAVEFFLTRGPLWKPDSTTGNDMLWDRVVEEYTRFEQIDKMLAFIHSPRIPSDLRQRLYFKAGLALFQSRQLESCVTDAQKLYDLLGTERSPISTPKIQMLAAILLGNRYVFQTHFHMHHPLGEPGQAQRVLLLSIDWKKLVEDALATKGDYQVTTACNDLAGVISKIRSIDDTKIDTVALRAMVEKRIAEETRGDSDRFQALQRLHDALR